VLWYSSRWQEGSSRRNWRCTVVVDGVDGVDEIASLFPLNR
jgi:hypothetical protein